MKPKLIALSLTLALAGVTHRATSETPSSKKDAAWVNGRVNAWQPTEAEKAFDKIGWAGSVREALRLGKEHNRPIFLFTYDGASLSCYRC